MRRIDLTSAAFLLAEKRETPMHVGGVNLYTLPRGVSVQEFVGALRMDGLGTDDFREPFGEFVTTGRAGPMGPLYWEKDQSIDMDYHVRHSALPSPGRFRELFALVSRLHSTLLDRNRPLWELHLIEGLQNHQLAVYMKMHHAEGDITQLSNGVVMPNPRYKIIAQTERTLIQLAGKLHLTITSNDAGSRNSTSRGMRPIRASTEPSIGPIDWTKVKP